MINVCSILYCSCLFFGQIYYISEEHILAVWISIIYQMLHIIFTYMFKLKEIIH